MERSLQRDAAQLETELGLLHDPAGVNTERVEHFFKALGLPLSRYAIMDEAKIPQAIEVLRKTGLSERHMPQQGFHLGIQLPLHDYAFVFRDGTYSTERTLVHEMGHTINRFRLPSTLSLYAHMISKRPLPPIMMGFNRSSFNDEGRSEMVAGSYAQLFQGATDCYPDILLPKKYLRTHPYACGGIALEALCTRTPELVDHLLAANHEPEAVTKVKDMYDDIQPGLFDYLEQDLRPLDVEEFGDAYGQALARVLDATGYGYKDMPAIHAQGVVVNRVQSLLDTYTAETGYIFQPDTP